MSKSRFPGYDVLDRRFTQSWDEKTRQVVEKRMSVQVGPRFFSESEWLVLCAVCDRIVPQSDRVEKVPLAAYVDEKMLNRVGDGYRYLPLPQEGEAWKLGLAGIDATAKARHGGAYHGLPPDDQDAVLRAVEAGEARDGPFADMPSDLFFAKRILPDVTNAYYAHPYAWSEIGFGGPASPRGYVRMELNDRDPWEPAEDHGDAEKARRENARVL